MIPVVALHFVAGWIAGTIFTVRALLVLVALVLIECAGVTIVWGVSVGFWSLASLITIQAGYVGGVYFRSVLEQVGIAQPNARPRHHS